MTTAVDRGWPIRQMSGTELFLVSTPTPTAAQKAAGVLTVAGYPIRVHPAVGPLFRGLIGDLQTLRAQRGLQPLLSAGGYNFRPIRGYELKWALTKNPKYLSNHSWGFAVDLNVPTNPMGSPVRSDFPRADTYAVAAKWGLQWGREWSRPDPQHFEFIGTEADARAAIRRVQYATTIVKEALMAAVDEFLPGGNHYNGNPETLGYAVREMESRIVGQIVTALAASDAKTLAAIADLPRLVSNELLNRELAASTWNGGDITTKPATVAALLTRASEASITAHIAQGETVTTKES